MQKFCRSLEKIITSKQAEKHIPIESFVQHFEFTHIGWHDNFYLQSNQFSFIRKWCKKLQKLRQKRIEKGKKSISNPKTISNLPRQAVALILIFFCSSTSASNTTVLLYLPYGVCVFMYCSQLSAEIIRKCRHVFISDSNCGCVYGNLTFSIFSVAISLAYRWVKIQFYINTFLFAWHSKLYEKASINCSHNSNTRPQTSEWVFKIILLLVFSSFLSLSISFVSYSLHYIRYTFGKVFQLNRIIVDKYSDGK